jgi:dipeptide transport system substrate-binding protein
MRRNLGVTALGFLLFLTASPVAAKTLIYCSEADPRTLDPNQSIAISDVDAVNPIYNRLVELERGGTKVLPALAESWEISDDSTVFTFKLRKGVKWHSNAHFTPSRDFNADDVVFSFRRQMDPNDPYYKIAEGNFGIFGGMGMDKSLKGVEKLDDLTVRFTLASPDVSFLALLTTDGLAIISAEYAETLLAAGTPERLADDPIGTGPFRFVSFERSAQIRFAAFPDYWAIAAGENDRTAKVDELVFAITPDPAVRLAKLRAGECHIMRFPNPADIKIARNDPTIVVHELPSVDYGFLSFNVEKKPFDDPKVRLALSLAVDKQAIIDAVYLGEVGSLPGSLIPPGMLGHDESIGPIPYDPVRAKQLLSEAGYPDGFKSTLWAMPVVRAYMPNAQRAAELMQADFAKIGVDVDIVSFEWGEYLDRSKNGEHEMVIIGLNYDYADPGSVIIWGWTCESAKIGYNRSRWCNEEFDGAIYAAARTADDGKRNELYRKAEAIFNDEVPAMLIAYARFVAFSRPEVDGYKIAPTGSTNFFGIDLKP